MHNSSNILCFTSLAIAGIVQLARPGLQALFTFPVKSNGPAKCAPLPQADGY
jgi:hypothetical protein